jgi:methylglutaconyl-CoA hydratase
VRDDPDCQVIVIDGAGPSFCAGWDVEAATALRALPVAAVEAAFERNRVLLEDLESAPQVTVAAVHGAVMGFGLGLVARCDIALAAESTLVALPEIAHRIVPRRSLSTGCFRVSAAPPTMPSPPASSAASSPTTSCSLR